MWAWYDESPGEPQVVFEDEQVRVTGPLVGRLGWDFDVYDCLIEPASTPDAREKRISTRSAGGAVTSP